MERPAAVTMIGIVTLLLSAGASAQDVLPFPSPPMGGKVGPTMQESVHKWRTQPRHLPEDAPNILIVMLDDAGFGQPDTFGGEIHTPTMSRLAKTGISYNAFHTVAMCSPTRAALMTGRNHNRVGFGQIAELANDWDGYTGVIPKSSATIAEVLGYYGYASSAFGKDHNTPVEQIAKAIKEVEWVVASDYVVHNSSPVSANAGLLFRLQIYGIPIQTSQLGSFRSRLHNRWMRMTDQPTLKRRLNLPLLTIFGLGTMVGAGILHLSRKEYQGVVINFVLLLMALFVAYGRFVLVPLA